MLKIHPQYITDANGKKSLVVLPADEFDFIMEELESNEEVKLYDEAKKEDTGERILLADYLKQRETNHA